MGLPASGKNRGRHLILVFPINHQEACIGGRGVV